MRMMVGLPTLSRGPLLDAALELRAPVMVSASALARWRDEGPVPPGREFTAMEEEARRRTGDRTPPTPAQRRRRVRTWDGWNTAALDRIADMRLDLSVDSAGFVAMALWGGHVWTPESYVMGLCVHPAITRFSAMDLCVEREVSDGDASTAERISKTIRLNRLCHRLAVEAGNADRMMPVIQGRTAGEYLDCFEAIAGIVAPGATIGVGSMCRRPTGGPDGSIAVLDALDRNLPQDVRLHLFGLKSDAAEAATALGRRVDSVDSQAYGVRARMMANERRREDPGFSKTNAFLAEVMRDWYRRQSKRLESPRAFPAQPVLDLAPRARPRNVLDAIETLVRAEFNALVETGDLEYDQIVGGRMLEEEVLGHVPSLPRGVCATDAWTGPGQLPRRLRAAGRERLAA